MMQEKNELNDIILNRGSSNNNSKKIILAVATLGVILIIVVMLMNTLTSTGTDNLPQAVLPPEPKTEPLAKAQDEPLFEEVKVIKEDEAQNSDLDKIAQRLKEESIKEPLEEIEQEPVAPREKIVKEQPRKVVQEPAPEPKESRKVTQKSSKVVGAYYVQVGSFSKYEPDTKFLKSITSRGYKYIYHKVIVNGKGINKVLIGPFKNEAEAREKLKDIRSKIESGAFLTKI